MSRGNGWQAIFLGDLDRQNFLKSLAETCEIAGCQARACCRMDSHFHPLVEKPNAKLVAGVKWFLSAYTPRYNRRNRLVGHVFSGRYKALVVDGSGDDYFRMVRDYGELKRESAEAKAERIIGKDLRRLRWTEDDLRDKPKSDPAKLAIVARSRRETTLTLAWVAARLRLGTWKSAAAKLRRWKLSRDR